MASTHIKNVDTIVVAVDLNVGSAAVLTRGIQLATAHAAKLVLLHVIEAEALSQAASVLARSESDLRNQIKRQALATIEPLLIQSERTKPIDVQVEFGPPHDIITRMAEQRHADVIVVGPGKRRSLKEKFLGGTADRVIRTAHTSVLVVRRRSQKPYRQVAVAVDFSPESAAAATEACRLVPDAALQLIHAVDVPLTFQQAMLRAGTPQNEIQEFRLARVDKARHNLSAFGRAVVALDKVPTRVLEGTPAPALIRLSRTRSIDLLAIGPHGVNRQAKRALTQIR